MTLLNSLVDGASAFGLAVYGTGMIMITGALAWATHLDHQRDRRRQGLAKR